jgi:CRP-like cAMP-binding protein
VAEGHILARLDSAARRVLLQSGRDIDCSQQTVFHRRGERIEDLFFPSSSVVSLLVELEEGRRAEVAMVGREGTVGVEAVFGVTKIGSIERATVYRWGMVRTAKG